MCLRCQSNTFPLFDLSNLDVSLTNSGFNNFRISRDTNIFPDDNRKSFFTKCNSIETPFNDSDHPVSLDSKQHDINKNSSLATLHLNTASLSKHFEDLKNFSVFRKHSFDINNQTRKTLLSTYLAIHSVSLKPKHPNQELVFVSNNLIYTLRPETSSPTNTGGYFC